MSDPLRARLVRFFEHYNPDKLSGVDTILQSYGDREEQLFVMLEKKYGPENAIGTASPQRTANESAERPHESDTRARVISIFQKYNPERLGSVDMILKKYEGRDAELFHALEQKYGPEPGKDEAAGQATPSRASSVPPPQTSPSPPPAATAAPASADDTRTRLEQYFKKVNPERLSSIDTIMKSYAGREPELFRALEEKYGVPVSACEDSVQATSPVQDQDAPRSPPSSVETPEDTRARLEQYFKKVNPERLNGIDTIMKSYAGREAELYRALEEKYGVPVETTVTPQTATLSPKDELTEYLERKGLCAADALLMFRPADEYLANFCQRFGPDTTPSPGGDYTAIHNRLLVHLLRYAPHKVEPIHHVATDAVKGKNIDAIMSKLVAKYGPEMPNTDATSEGKVVRLLLAHAPRQLKDLPSGGLKPADADALATRLSGQHGPVPSTLTLAQPVAAACRLNTYFVNMGLNGIDTLLQLYPPPKDFNAFMAELKQRLEAPAAPPVKQQRQAQATAAPGDVRTRVRRMLEKYCPERLSSADDMFRKFAGRENELLASLIKKFGPEPVATPAAPPPQQEIQRIRLMTRKKKARVEDEDELTDQEEEDRKLNERLAAERDDPAPPELSEAAELIEESKDHDPGEFSGDESAAFPEEIECWTRVHVSYRVPTEDEVVPELPTRQRAFTEFVPAQITPRGGSGGEHTTDEESPQNSPRPPPPPEKIATVHIHPLHRREETKELCATCSQFCSRMVDAVWTPVGGTYRQLINSKLMKEGYLEKLGSGFTTKWQRRWFRINDKGATYFETEKPNEKSRGHKAFSADTRVLSKEENSPLRAKCTDPRYFYIVIRLTTSDRDDFCVRTTTEQLQKEWSQFITAAVERLKLTLVGKDPNPARWRARVDGLKEVSMAELERGIQWQEKAKAACERTQRLRNAVVASQRTSELETNQIETTASQITILKQRLEESKQHVAALRAEADSKCAEADEQLRKIEERKQTATDEAAQRSLRTKELRDTLIKLECDLLDAEYEQKEAKAHKRKVFERWRRAEQRQPSAAKSRSTKSQGLVYKPPTTV